MRRAPFALLALAPLALVPFVLACRSRGRADVERFPAPPLAGRDLPFAEAVRVGDLLFLSGQLGNRPGSLELVPGGIGPETRQTMENLGAALARHGLGFGHVVKCTVMLADMAEWQAMNAEYVGFFAAGELPARSALGASGLALGARVEIECVAALPARSPRER